MSRFLARRFLLPALLLTSSCCLLAAEKTPQTTARIDKLAWRGRVSGNKASESVSQITTILSPAGSAYASVSLEESPFVKVKSVEIRVLDAAGKPLYSRKKKDMLKSCGFGGESQLYSDQCSYDIELSSPKYPYTIELDYELELLSLFFLRGISLQSEAPIKQASVELTFPTARPIRYRLYGLDALPTVQDNGEEQKLTWLMTDIPATPDIDYLPPDRRKGARLTMAAERFDLEKYRFDGLTWKNVGLWYRSLALGRGAMPDTVGPRPASDAEAVAVADSLYLETTRNIRYVAVSIGLSGWQPNPVVHTQKKGYGDCKDLSAMLVSRLRANGISAFPCLILTHDEGALDTGFVSFRFNHVITAAFVGRDTLWFDPTCRECPPGVIPSADENNPVLVVTDTGGVLAATPQPKPEENRVSRKTEVTIDNSGRVVLKTVATLLGHQASYVRSSMAHLNNDERREFLRDWLLGGNTEYTLSSCEITGLDDLSRPLGLAYVLARGRPAERVGATTYFHPFVFAGTHWLTPEELATRQEPVWFGYPWETIDTVVIRGALVESADSVAVPQDTAASFDNGAIAARFLVGKGDVSAVLVQTRSVAVVPVTGFGGLSQYLSCRKRLLDQPVRLRAKSRE